MSQEAQNPVPATAEVISSLDFPAALSACLAHIEAGRFQDAQRALEALLSLELDASQKRVVKSYLAIVNGKTKKVQIETEPTDPLLLGQILLNRNQAREALDLLKKALQTQPNRGQLHYLAALASLKVGEADSAKEYASKALSLNPELKYTFQIEPDFQSLHEDIEE